MAPKIADYGDGGSNKGAGKAATVHGGGRKIAARPVTPSSPSGASYPRAHGGAPTIVSFPTPMTSRGAGSPEGAPSGGASKTDDGAI